MDRSTDMTLFLALISLVFVVWVTRSSWVRKQCPFCRLYIPAQATKCEYCHEWYPRAPGARVVLVLLSSLAWAGIAAAQSFQDPTCMRTSFFAEEACGQAVGLSEGIVVSPVPEPPLFTRETVSPYTPPELLQLSNHRTLEQARKYVQRERARSAATEEVTRLVHQAWQELGVPYAR